MTIHSIIWDRFYRNFTDVSIRMEKKENFECGCWWTEYFRNCWDFPAQPSLELTENGWNKRKCPVSSSSLGEKCLVNTTGRRRIAKLLQHPSLRVHNDGAFQQINKPCHDVQIISNCFLDIKTSFLHSNDLHSLHMSIQKSTFGMLWN